MTYSSSNAGRSTTELNVDCLQGDDAFDKLKAVWQTLERRDTECTPFNTWLWLSLWWKHYARSSDMLAILIARKGPEVVAIAPLYIEQTHMSRIVPVKVLRLIGSGRDTSPDYLNILAIPRYRQAAEAAFLDNLYRLTDWQKLYFSDIRADSSFAAAVRRFVLKQKGVAVPERVNNLLRASLPGSWDEYRSQLSRKRRKQINHRQNRLDAAGVSELCLCASREELNEASEALAVLHRLRWQSKGEPGAFATESYEQFHRAVIREFFAADALWLATLKLDGEIIGVQYIFNWRGELLFFQSGYSPAHEALSPGHVLFTYVIQRGIEQGLTGLDMLKGDYGYKTAYAKDQIQTCDLGLVRPGARSLIARLLYSRRSK